MRHHLGIGIGGEFLAERTEFLAQFLEILDDAVVDDGDLVGRMRVRVVLGRPPMGRPARMADADRAGERLLLQDGAEIAELSFRAAAVDPAILQRRDAGGIVAAIFEALQAVEQQGSHFRLADDADDAAHARVLLTTFYPVSIV